MTRALGAAAAVAAIFLGACTHDFSAFDPLEGTDGGAVGDLDATSDAPPPGEAAPPPDVSLPPTDGAPSCGDECRTEATSCAGTCAQVEQSCAAGCDGGSCVQACTSGEKSCVAQCVSQCETCTSQAGCIDPQGCKAAAP